MGGCMSLHDGDADSKRRPNGPLQCGPLLFLDGVKQENWHYHFLFVVKAGYHVNIKFHDENSDGEKKKKKKEPGMKKSASAFSFASMYEELVKFNDEVLVRMKFQVRLTGEEQIIKYSGGLTRVDGVSAASDPDLQMFQPFTYEFFVPASGDAPNLAVSSCNDLHEERSPDTMWARMLDGHNKSPRHVLAQIGDQIYIDGALHGCKSLKHFWAKPFKHRAKVEWTVKMEDEVESAFWNKYVSTWSYPNVAQVMARIPSFCMWDDHDIFDGFGSYPDVLQHCEVFSGLGKLATKYFRLFQLGILDNETHMSAIKKQNGLSLAIKLGGGIVAIALDHRSERTPDQVMSPQSWEALSDYMAKLENVKHLLICVGIPVAYNSFNLIEYVVCKNMPEWTLADDISDQWHAEKHHGERVEMLTRLRSVAQEKKCRVTILSGDVHVGCAATINVNTRNKKDNSSIIENLTTSGIGSPVPPLPLLAYLDLTKSTLDRFKDDMTGKLHKFEDGTVHMKSRNFMTLDVKPNNELFARWHLENDSEDDPFYSVSVVPYKATKKSKSNREECDRFSFVVSSGEVAAIASNDQ